MNSTEELIRFESADSAIAFRERAYGKGEQADMLRDLVALANASVAGPRYLFLGVGDELGRERTFPGISGRVWTHIRELLPVMASRAIDPPLRVRLRSIAIDGALVGVICLETCDDRPYLFSHRVAALLPPGSGWIRRGASQAPLLRKDLQRLFETKSRSPDATSELRIGFPGRVPCEEITLSVLPLDALPSEVAARRLVKLLDAQRLSKAVLGTTDTRIARLLHAQVSGETQVYKSRGTKTLRQMLRHVPEEYASQDEYYRLETRAHKLNLMIANLGDLVISNAQVVLKIPRLEGVGIAEELQTPADETARPRGTYPLVDNGSRTINVRAEGISLPGKAAVEVFREPLRLWLREPAAGKSIPVSYSLQGRGLSKPLQGTLRIHVAGREPAARQR